MKIEQAAFEREERYIVIKISKLGGEGHAAQAADIDFLKEAYAEALVTAVVVERDWPEYEPTWQAIETRMTARAQLAQQQEPVFWYRPRSDGCYEGPIHNEAIERVRKMAGVWVPLYARSAATAQPAQISDELLKRLRFLDGRLEMLCHEPSLRKEVRTLIVEAFDESRALLSERIDELEYPATARTEISDERIAAVDSDIDPFHLLYEHNPIEYRKEFARALLMEVKP